MYTEEQLIRLCLEKDRRALEAFYKKYHRFVFSVSYLYLKEDYRRQEAVSNTFVKVFRSLDQYRSEQGTIMTWIRKIAVNTCLDLIKYQKNNLISLESMDVSATSVEYSSIENLDLKRIMVFLDQMKYPKGEIVKLYCVEGYSHGEIASMLQISEQMSRVLLHSARNEIRTHFQYQKSDGF